MTVKKHPKKRPAPRTAAPARGLFGDVAVRRATVIGGALGVVLALAGLLVAVWPDHADLEVADFAIRDPTSIDAELYDVSARQSPQPTTVDVNLFDISLRNAGDISAVITSVEVTVTSVFALSDCREIGGEMRVAAQYSVPIPTDGRQTPFTVDRPIAFEVEAHRADRLSISLGPDEQSAAAPIPYLYVADVALIYNDGEDRVETGSAAVISPPIGASNTVSLCQELGYFDALQHNVTGLTAARDAAEHVSADVDDALEVFVQGTALDDIPARPSCTELDPLGLPDAMACLEYHTRELTLTVTGLPTPPGDAIQLVMRATEDDTQRHIRWAFRTVGGSWRAGFIDEDTGDRVNDGHQCGSCEILPMADGVRISIPSSQALTSSTFDAIFQLVDFTNPDAPVILASTASVGVTRGA